MWIILEIDWDSKTIDVMGKGTFESVKKMAKNGYGIALTEKDSYSHDLDYDTTVEILEV